MYVVNVNVNKYVCMYVWKGNDQKSADEALCTGGRKQSPMQVLANQTLGQCQLLQQRSNLQYIRITSYHILVPYTYISYHTHISNLIYIVIPVYMPNLNSVFNENEEQYCSVLHYQKRRRMSTRTKKSF